MVKVHKNSYVSFFYKAFFWKYDSENCSGNDFEMWLPSYKVSVLYWDKVGSSEKSLLILEVVFGERSHLVQST